MSPRELLERFQTAGGPAAAWERRVRLDQGLLVVLAFLMLDRYTGNIAHEVAGVLMLAPVILHVAVNAKWCRRALGMKDARPGRARKPRPAGAREIVLRLLNALLALSFAASLVSGVMCSQTLFASLTPEDWRMSLEYRAPHVGLSVWFFLLAALHAGLHAGVFVGKTTESLRRFHARAPWAAGVGVALAAWVAALAAFGPREADLLMALENAYIPVERGEWPTAMPADLLAVFLAAAGTAALVERTASIVKEWKEKKRREASEQAKVV